MIQFSNLTRVYQQGKRDIPAIQKVSGHIAKGEMVALCGPSGAGKSTLLSILGLLDTQYSGKITLNDEQYPLRKSLCAQWRRTMFGFVFQRFNLIPVMSVQENVAYPLYLNGCVGHEQRLRVNDILEKVGLADYQHALPDTLSGGQQQRVAIARALVHQPQIVIADEPTASLDSHTTDKVIDVMKALGHEMGTTFILATHDDRLARRCDRTIRVLDGRINSDLSEQEGLLCVG